MDHRHQHAGVAGQLRPHGPRHAVRQGCAQTTYEGVHDEPGRAGGHVLVHPLPVYPGLHHPPHHHQHLLLPHPLPRLQLHPPRQTQAVRLG